MYKIINFESEELQWLYAHNVEYYDYGDCKRYLQIIFPFNNEKNKNEKYPLILFIPGSAWHKQELYNDIPQYVKMAQKGYVVAVLQYRESDIEIFPAQVQDVGNALDFIPSVAENFNIDIEKVFLMGNSSGGHIAMMKALFDANGIMNSAMKISGVIVESGSTDLLICSKNPIPSWMNKRPSAELLGVDKIEGNEEVAKNASCAKYITKDITLPPVLLIHSENDPVVSVENSRYLYDSLVDCGKEVDFYEIKDCYAHGGPVFWNNEILDTVDEFCKKILLN